MNCLKRKSLYIAILMALLSSGCASIFAPDPEAVRRGDATDKVWMDWCMNHPEFPTCYSKYTPRP